MSDAIFDYEQALELDSENWDIRTRLSFAHYLNAVDYYNKSNYRQAERHLDSAIK
jgi:tetratricopeptide (TPR) repeat protein